MSLQSFSASTQALKPNFTLTTFSAATTLASFGGWFKATAISNGTPEIIRVGSTNIRWVQLNQSGTGALEADIDDNIGSSGGATTASSFVGINDWIYFVARYITNSLRRLDALNLRTGQIVGVSDVTTVTATSADHLVFGPSNNLTSNYTNLAEVWAMGNSKAFPADSAAALSPQLMWQLAMKGPLSFSHLASQLDFYAPLKDDFNYMVSSLTGGGIVGFNNQTQMDFSDGSGGNAFTNASNRGNVWGPHPPLPSDYVSINQAQRYGFF